MAKINSKSLACKSPVLLLAGLFCVLLLFGCEPPTPESVTSQFWQALAQGQLDAAKIHVTPESQNLVNTNDIDLHSTISTGAVTLEGEGNALVSTTITRNKKQVTFDTVLLKDNKQNWKVDFSQTHTNIAMVPFDGIAKKLEEMGDKFAKEVEKSVPLIEKEMENFGNELKGQLDEFGRSIKKSPQRANPNPSQPNPTKPVKPNSI